MLQTISMATPANAETLKLSELEVVQTMTTKDTPIQVIPERESYAITWITFPLDNMGYDGISSYFGYRKKPCSTCSSSHSGIDFPQAYGSPIRSIFYGEVITAGYKSGNGYTIEIRHPELDGIVTEYAHMKKGSFKVNVGDRVYPGKVIGEVGSTGASTGNHLHFAIWVDDGRYINPLTWLKNRQVRPYQQYKMRVENIG